MRTACRKASAVAHLSAANLHQVRNLRARRTHHLHAYVVAHGQLGDDAHQRRVQPPVLRLGGHPGGRRTSRVKHSAERK